MKKLPLTIVVVLLALAARAASAAEDPKKLFETATAEFNLGHYEKAAGMYEEIYKITLEPVLLYNIAQAHRLGGDFDKAVFFYRGFLRAQPQAKNHVEVQKRIAELELAIEAKKRGQERPPNVPATVEPKSRPQTAAAQPQPTPTPTPPPPTPEPTTQPQPTEPTPVAQATPPTEPQPQPTAANEPSSSSDKPIWKKWWFWTIIGGVVVVGVVVAVAVVATQSPSFGANLPESGPAAHALTSSNASQSIASTLRMVEVRF